MASLFRTQILLITKWKLERNRKQERQFACNVKLMRVLATILAVEKQ